MQYTVSQMAAMLGLSAHTLRYYSKAGLLPFVDRDANGHRAFKPKDFEWLFLIECLKKSGMTLMEIKDFVDLAMQGDDTIDQRLAMFHARREILRGQLEAMQDTLAVLDYKCWFYETAKAAGATAVPREMPLEDIPVQLHAARKRTKHVPAEMLSETAG